MFHATMRSAIEAARTLAQLDSLSRTIWQAHAAETITDEEAQGLAELLHTRSSAVRDTVAPVGIPLGRVTLFPPKPYQRAPERSVAIERRRRLACSGPMPPALASRFTTGQLAVLRIVGDEMARNGACGLCSFASGHSLDLAALVNASPAFAIVEQSGQRESAFRIVLAAAIMAAHPTPP
ncbi:hypothetical protein MKK88_13855 [Methylobacterium sp. E-005]|uniref:hypothetical protein n=1 Tax=Methylobacterium sp. E-005 TaxID=2836549 RepID=UPI001FB99D86|nr:hypothetical protein [Methylobacterium sp. E-005]MCJ2087061.1 hypothetical protein [Methylobacterium sp. E-005]